MRYAVFHWIFEICGGGGHLFIEKQCTLRDICILKNNALCVTLIYIQKQDTMRYILISEKQYTFLYVYIYIIYSVVLIPNYKRTYDQSDQIEK